MCRCSIPQWLAPFRVDDAALAAAYEATAAEHRAWIKTTLALVDSRYGESASVTCRSWENRHLGFAHTQKSVPAPWTVVVLAPGFASAPRLAASLMVARLAQVEPVLVIRQLLPPSLSLSPMSPMPSGPAECPWPPALLAAIELAGVEDCFSLTTDNMLTLLRDLAHQKPQGRLLLHTAAAPASAASMSPEIETAQCVLRDYSRQARLPLWEQGAPHVGLSPLAQVDENLLHWAHPDARLTRLDSLSSLAHLEHNAQAPFNCPPFDVILCESLSEELPATAPLLLPANGPEGLTGAWLPANLSPDFFLNQTQGAMFRIGSDTFSPHA